MTRKLRKVNRCVTKWNNCTCQIRSTWPANFSNQYAKCIYNSALTLFFLSETTKMSRKLANYASNSYIPLYIIYT